MTQAVDRSKPPVAGAAPSLRTPPVQRFALSNGVPVLFVEHRGLPVVDIQLIFRVTAFADPADITGRMSLAVDMLDEGAGGRSALDIAEAIEDLGASLSSSASWDDIALGMHAHTDRIADAVQILGDMILRPTFDADEFDRKKAQRLTSILQQKEEPRALVGAAFGEVVFGRRHPYGRPLNGTRTSASRITRDEVAAFHAQYIRPDNAFFVVAGDVNQDALHSMLERAFGEWNVAPSARSDHPVAADRLVANTGVYVVDRPGSAQSELRIGNIGTLRATGDYFPILVMNTIFGGSFTSRLNLNLRQDKGYTYGAGSSFGMRLAPGPFAASSAVDTHVTDDAIRQVLLEMARMRDEIVPADELERAKSYIALGLPRTFETTSDIANHIAEIELYHLGSDYYDTYVDRIRAVTAEEVQRVARRYMDPAAVAVTIAGDFEAIRAPLEALGIGPVERKDIED